MRSTSPSNPARDLPSGPPPDSPPTGASVRQRPDSLWGVLLLVAAVACFSVLDTTTQHVTAELPILTAVWGRNVFQTLITTALIWTQGRGPAGPSSRLWHTRRPGLHLVRGMLMLVVTVTAFASLQFMPVGEFTAVVMTTPLLVTLLAARLLGEHVSLWRVLLVGGGFAGTLVIVRPGANMLGWSMLLPLMLVLANAGFQLLTSRLARSEHPLTIQLYTAWIGTLATSLPLYWFWSPVPTLSLWLGLGLMGAASAAGHYMLVMAFMRSPAAVLMPYMYLQIGFSVFLGWLVFDHFPDHWSLVGIGVIAVCGTAGAGLTLFENRARERNQARKHRPGA